MQAIRAQAAQELEAGRAVPGWKLVEGRAGNRAWTNAEAEAVLKAMRVKHEQMYDYKLISPTTAEKLAKAEVIGPASGRSCRRSSPAPTAAQRRPLNPTSARPSA